VDCLPARGPPQRASPYGHEVPHLNRRRSTLSYRVFTPPNRVVFIFGTVFQITDSKGPSKQTVRWTVCRPVARRSGRVHMGTKCPTLIDEDRHYRIGVFTPPNRVVFIFGTVFQITDSNPSKSNTLIVHLMFIHKTC